MAIYVGEVVAAWATATHPFTGELLIDLTGEVELYAAGSDPKGTPADRVPLAGYTTAAAYDADSGGYVAYVSTVGLAGGKYPYRFRLTSVEYDTWEYGSFRVLE